MERVYFDGIRNEIINLLENAHDTIVVAMAWFTNENLLDCLITKLRDGVKVRLLILDDEINRNDSFGLDFSKFIEAKGQLYLYDPSIKLMHDKFCVVDDSHVVTGSYNWTNYAETRNIENIIITDDKSTIKDYQDCFSTLCKDLKQSEQYSRIPSAMITRETIRGNYEEFELEKQIFEQRSAQISKGPIVVEHENRQNPKANFHIGFHAYINGNNDGLRVLVAKGTDLPVSVVKDAWLNNDNIDKISCEIYYGDNDNSINGNTHLTTLELNIPRKKAKELNFKTKVTLDTNAYLHVEFVCVETGKSKDITICREFLVKYDN